MTRPNQTSRLKDKLWVIALAVGLPVLIMCLRGIDANWDLRNYHLYNPHAWLTGRMAMDVAPAQLQTWHNPLLDVPLYLLVMSGWSARWATLWLTVPFITSLYFLLGLQRSLSQAPPSRLSQVVLALLALTGAATYSTLANSMNDGFVAAAIIGSLFLLLSQDNPANKHWLVAGLLAGGIMGLKLTASSYCLGFAVVALVGGPWMQRLQRTLSLAAGGLAGFLLTYGYWGWRMYATHGNPFFPYYNDVFKAPELGAHSYANSPYAAHSLTQALYIPISLLHKSVEHCELFMRDPRLLLGALSLIGLFLLDFRGRSDSPSPRKRITLLLVFFLAGYFAWAFQYGIYRYAQTLELLGSLALLLLLDRLPRGRAVALLVATVVVSVATTRPNWGHVESTAPMLGIQPAPIPRGSLVLIANDEPIAFMALGLSRETPLVAVSDNILSPKDCSQMQLRAKDIIARHPGPIWLLSGDSGSNASGQRLLSDFYGLRQSGGQCRDFKSSLQTALLCPQMRVSPPTLCEAPVGFVVKPGPMVACGPGVVSEVSWSLLGATPPVTATQIWVANKGGSWALFTEGGVTGDRLTGPWNFPGIRYELRDKNSGRTIASASVDGPACPTRP